MCTCTVCANAHATSCRGVLCASCVHTKKLKTSCQNLLPGAIYSILNREMKDLEYCKVQSTTETAWQQWGDALTTVCSAKCVLKFSCFLAFLYGVLWINLHFKRKTAMDIIYLSEQLFFLISVWFLLYMLGMTFWPAVCHWWCPVTWWSE